MAAIVTNRPIDRINAVPTYAGAENMAANIPFFRRISWGAILAGVVVALVIQLAFNALGLSVGATAVEPLTNQGPSIPEFGVGLVVWMAASALISLFLGGYVAGRMAGTIDNHEGIIHGVIVWAVVVLFSVYLLTTTVGNILGGVVNVLGTGLNLAGQGAGAIAPEIADSLEAQDISLQGIREQVTQLFITPDAEASTSGTAATTSTTQTDAQMSAAERQVNLALTQLFRLGLNADDATRQDVITSIATATGRPEEEIRLQVVEWEQQIDTVKVQAEETARQVSGDFADTVARVAGIIFAILVVGALASGIGGMLGSPEPEDVVREAQMIADKVSAAEVR